MPPAIIAAKMDIEVGSGTGVAKLNAMPFESVEAVSAL
jgi:hypothetical protein